MGGSVGACVLASVHACLASVSFNRSRHLVSASLLAAPARTVAQMARDARKPRVVIVCTGRDGKRVGRGPGFVVSADGLIATNLHVIGDARPITVELDGKRYDATAVHATDRAADLAVIR